VTDRTCGNRRLLDSLTSHDLAGIIASQVNACAVTRRLLPSHATALHGVKRRQTKAATQKYKPTNALKQIVNDGSSRILEMVQILRPKWLPINMN